MNLCNEEFLKRNKIDKNELRKNVDSKIYSFSEINPLAEIVYFQKREERKNISIANIVGYNYQFYSAPNDIIESLDNFFDSEGDGYHSRSVGILEYDRDYILDKLQDSFKMEPMVVADTGEGKYTISTNGLHRFTVLRLLYLSEVVQAKGDPRKLDELEKKYTIPVQLQGIEFEKFMDGGHQEKNKRAGTENVASIVGLGKAAELAQINLENYEKYLMQLRNYFISQVQEKIQGVKLNGSINNRLPGNANFSFQGVEGETLLLNLDAKGICASSGSACTSGSSNPSHVLSAIGLSPELAHNSLRVTFGEDNTKEDVDYLVENLCEIVQKFRS